MCGSFQSDCDNFILANVRKCTIDRQTDGRVEMDFEFRNEGFIRTISKGAFWILQAF